MDVVGCHKNCLCRHKNCPRLSDKLSPLATKIVPHRVCKALVLLIAIIHEMDDDDMGGYTHLLVVCAPASAFL